MQVVNRHVIVEPGNETEWIDLLHTLARQLRRGFVQSTAIDGALRLAIDAAEDQERRRGSNRWW